MAPTRLTASLLAALSLASSTIASPIESSSKRDFATTPKLAVYWGNGNAQQRLADFCRDTTIDVIPIGFVNTFPDHSGNNGYPGTNYANACGSPYWVAPDGTQTKMFTECWQIAEDIPVCQALGKKILASIGGDTAGNTISSTTSAKDFADFLWGAYGPPQDTTETLYPRPFGQNVVDGFDLDIESGGGFGYADLVTELRSKFASQSKQYYISAAPQCDVPDPQLANAIQNADFDYIFVQYYNTARCSASSLFSSGKLNTATDITFGWANWLRTYSKNKAVQLYVGLPASESAANDASFYLSLPEVKALLEAYACSYTYRSIFGGVMLWEATYSANNQIDGKSYAQNVKELFSQLSCAPAVTTTTTSTTTTSTTTSTTTTTTTTQAPTTTTTTTTTVASTTTTTTTYEVPTTTTSTTTSEAPSATTTTSSRNDVGPIGGTSSTTTSTTPTATTTSATTTTSSGNDVGPIGGSTTTTGAVTTTTTSFDPNTSTSTTTSGNAVGPVGGATTTTTTTSAVGAPQGTSTSTTSTTVATTTTPAGTWVDWTVGSSSTSTSSVVVGPTETSETSTTTTTPFAWQDWSATVTVAPTTTTASETVAPDVTTTVFVTSYVDICPTGFTTRPYTLTTTITVTPSATVSSFVWPTETNGLPSGFTTTVTVCTQCAETTTTVTLTIPIATATAVLTQTVVPVVAVPASKTTVTGVETEIPSPSFTAITLASSVPATIVSAAKSTETVVVNNAAVPGVQGSGSGSGASSSSSSSASTAIAPAATSIKPASNSGWLAPAAGQNSTSSVSPAIAPYTGAAAQQQLPGTVLSVAVCMAVAAVSLFI
ncbi:Endochitinase A1 [Exophiala dermatitidis]